MPPYGLASQSMLMARTCLELCRFAYKAYAQSCQFPMDPFYESWGPGFKVMESSRDRLMAHIHDTLETPRGSDNRKFDPLLYFSKTPNPHKGVVYRGGIDARYILFQPRPLDFKIAQAQGFDLKGKKTDAGHNLARPTGNLRCGYFQGKTGMTQNHPSSGWPSYLGAVLYDPASQEAFIVFRGSRSGDGTRALAGAQTKSRGSPDWVTDMNHLKSVTVEKFGGSTLACGFYYAYESCVESLVAAYRYAVGGATPRAVYVTGHSLGGALAQCAYLDMTCGVLGQKLGVEDAALPKYCYPISAPPVCIGQTSHHWVSLHADAASIRHYYNPKDAVHACSLVVSSKFTKANSVMKGTTHPLTSTFHLGSQTALQCAEEFPNAHEPEHVWRGMHGGRSDSGFWPEFDLDVVSGTAVVKGLKDASLMHPLRDALKESCSMATCLQRATLWQNVVKDDDRLEGATAALQLFRTLNLSDDLDVLKDRDAFKQLQGARSELLKSYQNPSKHSASSSVSYTLLLGLSVRHLLSGALLSP